MLSKRPQVLMQGISSYNSLPGYAVVCASPQLSLLFLAHHVNMTILLPVTLMHAISRPNGMARKYRTVEAVFLGGTRPTP